MPGNTIGQCFTLTTFGESHGPAIGGIIDGCPPGIELDESIIQKDLDRRKPGQNRHTTQRREADKIKILSGVYKGKTTGTPIGLLIENIDAKSKDYSAIENQFRPGHADFTYFAKYGHRDPRGGGRSSARETAIRVAAGAIAKLILKQKGIEVFACVTQVGDLKFNLPNNKSEWEVAANNPYFCADKNKVSELEKYMENIRSEQNSIGAKISACVTGVKPGLGEPVFDRLDADIAYALMNINAAKGVEIGDGFKVISQKGSEHRDEIRKDKGFLSNHAGGVLGGISSGQDIIAHCAFKPTSSITTPGKTINESGEDVDIITKGRHDPCVGLRAAPIVEAMIALVLTDHLMRDFAQNDLLNTDRNTDKLHL